MHPYFGQWSYSSYSIYRRWRSFRKTFGDMRWTDSAPLKRWRQNGGRWRLRGTTRWRIKRQVKDKLTNCGQRRWRGSWRERFQWNWMGPNRNTAIPTKWGGVGPTAAHEDLLRPQTSGSTLKFNQPRSLWIIALHPPPLFEWSSSSFFFLFLIIIPWSGTKWTARGSASAFLVEQKGFNWSSLIAPNNIPTVDGWNQMEW